MFTGKWPQNDAVKRLFERSVDYRQSVNDWNYEKFIYRGINDLEKVGEGKIQIGELWDLDHTYFFTKEVTIPNTENNRDWYMQFDISGECEVYVNEVPVGSLDFNHNEVIIAENTCGGETVRVRIQATRHEHNYVRSERAWGIKYDYHMFRKADLVSYRKSIQEFAHLAKQVMEFTYCDLIQPEEQKALHEMMKDILFDIDYFAEVDQLEEQVLAGREQLLERMKAFSFQDRFGDSLFIGHSHLDLAFKWTYKETFRKIERTLSNTVSLVKKHPKATYIQSQMHIIEVLAKAYPDLFEKVKELIDAGNVEVVGDTYVEFDTNIPSGESLIRQFLVGKNIAKEITGGSVAHYFIGADGYLYVNVFAVYFDGHFLFCAWLCFHYVGENLVALYFVSSQWKVGKVGGGDELYCFGK